MLLPELAKKAPAHGLCLACMLTCHKDHEIIELYDRAHFRCDCGNSKLPFGCQLNDQKEYVN
jgi:E3 ubiquitin-protein ligase UBR7